MTKGNKKYIVLDIDATLVHTHGDMKDFKMLKIYGSDEQMEMRRKLYNMRIIDVSDIPGEGEVTDLAGIYRPYLKEFLEFCHRYFEGIIIWSAGKRKYVHKMCEYMFPLKKQPLHIFTYDDCEGDEDDFIVKPLEKLYKLHKFKNKMNEKNTFVLDDRAETFSLNKRNGIQIPEFESDMSVEDICNHPDDELLKLMTWLSDGEVKNSKDIRKINKTDIFNKTASDCLETLGKEKKVKAEPKVKEKAEPKEKKVKEKAEPKEKKVKEKAEPKEKKVKEKAEPKTTRKKK